MLKISSNLLKTVNRGLYTTSNWRTSTEKGDQEKNEKEISVPEVPKHCCMNGCANCVWIKYAQELAESFEDGDMIAKKKITENIQDPKLRAFLFTQLGLNESSSNN